MRRQLWWLVPLTLIWLVGMWINFLQFRIGAPPWAVVVVLVGNVVTFAVSAFVGVRRPDVRIGQLFAFATAGFAWSPFLVLDIAQLVPPGLLRPLVLVGAALNPPALAAICWVIALFPTGRHPTPRWRWISWYLTAFVLVGTPISVWQAATRDLVISIEEPLSVLMVAFVASVVSLGVRFRRGDRTTRAQVKWLFYAVAIYAVFLIVVGVGLFDQGIVGVALDQIFYVSIPLAIAIAVLRYRLYDIDQVVSRTVSYAVVVGVLGATYLGLVVVLRGLVPVSGDLPVAISTLVVALAFLPLVRRVQRVVDRRFFRSRYDAGVVVARVADELRGSLDLAGVTGRVEAVVDEVLAPEVVGVWVAEDRS
jgi:hypothetical protein